MAKCGQPLPGAGGSVCRTSRRRQGSRKRLIQAGGRSAHFLRWYLGARLDLDPQAKGRRDHGRPLRFPHLLT